MRTTHRPAVRTVLRCLGALGLISILACAPRVDPEQRSAAGAAREGSTSPRPRPELVESLREDLAAERDPGDGGGRAWLEPESSSPPPLTAGTTAHFTIVYEAGPLGVASGGVIILQPSSFWGWSPAHDLDPRLPGYTTVESLSPGLEIAVEALGSGLLGARIAGREMRPGERLRFRYGGRETGVRVDTYAEREAPIWIAVDADGDGVRALIAEPPRVDIVGGPATRLLVTPPSVVRPGTDFEVSLALVDRLGNAPSLARGPNGEPRAIAIEVESDPPGLSLPDRVPLDAVHGWGRFVARAPEAGIFRIRARRVGSSSGEDLEALSAPIFATPKLSRVLWGDLHGHSGISDGTGTADDYFTYARRIAALDVAALTDHDHWGMRPLASSPELWQRISDAVSRHHRPGEFVTLLGYEWTNWIHGHRHVLYFGERGEVLSSVDPAYEHPEQLWAALEGKNALTFTHHSAGEPIPTNWEIPPHPDLEPVAEIVSVHGSSEAADSPGIVRGAVAGNFVRDALDRGYRLGFIGSGDSHDGHPGLAGLASPSSGLAAILSEDLSREGVGSALRERRVYATNGPRILLHVTLDGRAMGSAIPAATGEADSADLVVLVLAPAPIARIELIRDGAIDTAMEISDGRIFWRGEQSVAPLPPGGYLYVRVLLEDGGAAWSSPFFGVDAAAR